MSSSGPKPNPSSRPPLTSGGAGGKTGPLGGKRLFPKSGPRKPLSKEQKPVVTIIGGIFIIIFISIFWYYFSVLPAKTAALLAKQEAAKKEAENVKLREDLATSQMQNQRASAVGLVTVATVPAGAAVTMEGQTQRTPATGTITFKNVPAGSKEMHIQLEGYDDVSRLVEVKENDISRVGLIKLVRSLGKIDIASPYEGVKYEVVLTPGEEPKTGKAPTFLTDVPTGNYTVTARRGDYTTSVSVTVKANETAKVMLDFSYGDVQVTSEPSGATVYEGSKAVGTTPLTLSQLRPGPVFLSLLLSGYKVASVTGNVTAGGKLPLAIKLEANRDMKTSNGLELVWMPAGYWVGRYEVTQQQFQEVTGFNPSAFSGLNKPVESVSWKDATEFCRKLTEKERAAGKLPSGYHFALPTESEWMGFTADATLDDSVTSRDESRNSTEDVGSMAPNQYGLFDTRGNVWEWCRNPQDSEGKTYPTRGACWLSSKEDDLKISGRSPASAGYKDKFVGFRVVLIKE
jgi:hypothetical protein